MISYHQTEDSFRNLYTKEWHLIINFDSMNWKESGLKHRKCFWSSVFLQTWLHEIGILCLKRAQADQPDASSLYLLLPAVHLGTSRCHLPICLVEGSCTAKAVAMGQNWLPSQEHRGRESLGNGWNAPCQIWQLVCNFPYWEFEKL